MINTKYLDFFLKMQLQQLITHFWEKIAEKRYVDEAIKKIDLNNINQIEHMKKIGGNDPANDKTYICSNGDTFATYDFNTLN